MTSSRCCHCCSRRFEKEVVVKNKLALVYVGTSQITTTNDFKTLRISWKNFVACMRFLWWEYFYICIFQDKKRIFQGLLQVGGGLLRQDWANKICFGGRHLIFFWVISKFQTFLSRILGQDSTRSDGYFFHVGVETIQMLGLDQRLLSQYALRSW